jgi:hypothetical protein
MLSVLVVVTSPGVAVAQYNVPSQATGDSSRIEIASDQVIASDPPKKPLGYELGASLDFLTRDREPGADALKFTDIVFFRLHGLVELGRRAELFAGIDLLPKQPSFTDELVWQGALVGVRRTLTKVLSTYVRGQGGPGLGRDGYWVMGEAAVQAKLHLAEKVLFWESTLGGTYTQLFPDEPVRRSFWQTELLAETGIAIREKRGFFAAWLSFAFHFPLVARPLGSNPDPDRGSLDPQTRVGVSLGMLAGVTRGLDLFFEVSTRDRGDFRDPRTTLPILSGGFDQQRILFGFNKRFGPRKH